MDTNKTPERRFLDGPQSRWKELHFTFKVLFEFIRGLRAFHFLGPCATVFGSARYKEGHPYYQLTREISSQLSSLGFTIMTGGGPGLMEAANRGAKESGGKSVGCNIVLPKEQNHNSYLDKWVNIDFFFVRKVLLSKYSYAFVVMPGGFGTLDEFFEAITLIQTHKTKRFPVVVMGKEYHQKLYDHILYLVKEGTIAPEDIDIFLFTDDVAEAVGYIEKFAITQFGLRRKKRIKPLWFFRESA
jgi:uncharacterized protein (TIGR00730 family)